MVQIKSMMEFLSGVQREFSRVIWPTKIELIGTTVVVLILVVFFSVYLGAVDFVLSALAARVF